MDLLIGGKLKHVQFLIKLNTQQEKIMAGKPMDSLLETNRSMSGGEKLFNMF